MHHFTKKSSKSNVKSACIARPSDQFVLAMQAILKLHRTEVSTSARKKWDPRLTYEIQLPAAKEFTCSLRQYPPYKSQRCSGSARIGTIPLRNTVQKYDDLKKPH